MNSKLINTVRWKFIYAFLLSGVLTAVILYGAGKLGETILANQPYPNYTIPGQAVRWLVNHIGSVPLMIAVGIICFVLFFSCSLAK